MINLGGEKALWSPCFYEPG